MHCYINIIDDISDPQMHINIFVNYEHFDAFGLEFEAHRNSYSMGKSILQSDLILRYKDKEMTNIINANIYNNESEFNIYLYPQNSSMDNASLKYNMTTYRGHWEVNAIDKNILTWKTYNNFNQLTKLQFSKCIKNNNNIFIGDSHMRFIWTYLTYEYLDAQQLYKESQDDSPEDIIFSNFSYIPAYYYMHLSKYINDINCTDSMLPMSIGIHSGSTELSATNLRNIIANPLYAKSLIDSIYTLSKKTCAHQIKIIFVNTM